MTDDPIVEEVHDARAKLLAEYGGSLDLYIEGLKARCQTEFLTEPIRKIEELQGKVIR